MALRKTIFLFPCTVNSEGTHRTLALQEAYVRTKMHLLQTLGFRKKKEASRRCILVVSYLGDEASHQAAMSFTSFQTGFLHSMTLGVRNVAIEIELMMH